MSVDTATVDAVERAAARIAGHGLAGVEAGMPVYAGDASSSEWAALVAVVASRRLAGLAVQAADDGALVAAPDARQQLVGLHEQQLAVDLELERHLRACARVLDSCGVEYRVLKGPALARYAYARPELRSFADVDVLVRGHQFDDAVDALVDARGLVRRYTEPRPGFDRRFGKGVCLTASDGLELDLHRTLSAGPYGALLDVDALFDSAPTVVVIGGRAVPALAVELAFVHACMHAVLGGSATPLVPLRDVATLAELMTAGELDSAARFSRASRVEAIVRLAVARAAETFAWTPPATVAARFERASLRGFDRWALAAYRPDAPSYPAQAAATFWVLPTLRDRVAYARALVWPDRSYLTPRDGSHARRLSRSATLGLRWRPR